MMPEVKNKDDSGPHRRHLNPAEGTSRCNMKNKRIAHKELNFFDPIQNMWDHSPRATKLAMGIFVSCSNWKGENANRTRADHRHFEFNFG